MIDLRQLLFFAKISQQDLLAECNYRCKKKVFQSRLSRIMHGKCKATEHEKNRIRLALFRLGFDDDKILKVRELVSQTRET